MIRKLTDDISKTTCISPWVMESLVKRAEECIGHDVFESIIENEDTTEVDIGIGVLYIKRCESQIKYKFIPSKKLEEKVQATVLNKKSPLISKGEVQIRERLERAYKDLI